MEVINWCQISCRVLKGPLLSHGKWAQNQVDALKLSFLVLVLAILTEEDLTGNSPPPRRCC